jgi:hypothetical protein
MGIVNRRNAMIGWTAWTIGKQVARKKARGRTRPAPSESRRPWRSGAVVLAAAAAVGAAAFWRLRSSGADEVAGDDEMPFQ